MDGGLGVGHPGGISGRWKGVVQRFCQRYCLCHTIQVFPETWLRTSHIGTVSSGTVTLWVVSPDCVPGLRFRDGVSESVFPTCVSRTVFPDSKDLTHRPQSSSFLGLPYRIRNMNPQKELLWGLWVITVQFTVLVGKLEDGLPRLAHPHGAGHLPNFPTCRVSWGTKG